MNDKIFALTEALMSLGYSTKRGLVIVWCVGFATTILMKILSPKTWALYIIYALCVALIASYVLIQLDILGIE